MYNLNFNNLDDKTQQRLLSDSTKEVEGKFGEDIKAYAEEHHLKYENVLHTEALRNLYNYKIVFTI